MSCGSVQSLSTSPETVSAYQSSQVASIPPYAIRSVADIHQLVDVKYDDGDAEFGKPVRRIRAIDESSGESEK